MKRARSEHEASMERARSEHGASTERARSEHEAMPVAPLRFHSSREQSIASAAAAAAQTDEINN